MTSHMKKKTKRFQDGGSAEDKKRGLGASKDDKVGFFERLRMGNIDDPSSEAFKRFGAGRGKAETAKEKEAIKSYKGSANPFQGDDVDPFSAVRKPSGEIMREPAKEPAKTPAKAKPAVVTKEQLKASGFDNLRDYLNAQRGLTRRGGAAATKSADKAAASRGPSRGTQDEGDAGEAEARTAQEAKMAKAREMRKQTDPGDVPTDVRRTQEASTKSKRRDMTGFAQMPFSEQMEYLRTKGKEGTGFKTKEKGPGLKAGGKVSSASKRGDGIAMRGKTRGRMV
jgi:hypothetical protein